MKNWDKETISGMYKKIINAIKSKNPLIYQRLYLNFARLELTENEMLIFDLDTGSIHKLIADEKLKKTDYYWYFMAKNEMHPDRTIDELKELLTQIEK